MAQLDDQEGAQHTTVVIIPFFPNLSPSTLWETQVHFV